MGLAWGLQSVSQLLNLEEALALVLQSLLVLVPWISFASIAWGLGLPHS